ncbi:MAG: tetratricopeptide repeat protein [Bacteroidaceae bacterium]|nr:tetratricopeptide repeat protein [Bacteroidaceae bacterium]
MRRIILTLLLPLSALCMRGQINADGVMRIGQNALYYEDYVLSIQYFNQAITAKPFLYEPYYYRAIAKYYLGDYYGAITDCTHSIECDPYITDVYRLRAINYIRTDNYEAAADDYHILLTDRADKERDVWYNAVICNNKLNRLTEADSLLDTMIVRWPEFAGSYMLKANIAIARADTLAGDSLLDMAILLDADNVDALSSKAMLSLQRQLYLQAETIYNRVLELRPNQGGFYINRALARYQQQNLRGAMSDYNVALELMPESYLGHYNRALLCMQVGENNRAIEDFDFVLSKRPNDRLALYNRAILSQQTGNYRRAISDYTTVLKDYPDFAGGYVNRAYCYRQIGDLRRSDADDRKAMQVRLTEAYHHKEYSSPLDSVTRHEDEADIEDYDKLVEDNEEEIVPVYASEYRGRVQNREVAVVHQPPYTAPEGEEPDMAHQYYNKGCAHSLNGESEKAEADYNMALELNPSLAEAYYNRGLDRALRGDKIAAMQDLSKAGELGLYTAYSLIKHFRQQKP